MSSQHRPRWPGLLVPALLSAVALLLLVVASSDAQASPGATITVNSTADTNARDAALSPGVEQPDLVITKTAVPSEATGVVTGATITYTLTASNTGDTTATNVLIRDTIGTGLTYILATPGTGVVCGDTTPPVIECTAASIAAGESRTVTIAATVNTASGYVYNGAYVDPIGAIAEDNEDADDPDFDCGATGGNVGEGTDTAPATEPDNFDCTRHGVGMPDLAITKTATPAEGTTQPAGSTITYTITVVNLATATGTATNVLIRDTIGSNLTYASATPGSWLICGDTTPPVIECTAASIAPGETRAVSIVATAAASTGALLNGAYVDPNNTITEINEDNDDALDCVAVGEGTGHLPSVEPDNFDCTSHTAGAVDLTITKTAVPAEGTTVPLGSTITYTLTASNAGSGTAANVPIRDILGTGLTYVSATGTGVTCTHPSAQQIDCTAASIAPSGSATVTIVATVSATSGSVLNGARVDPANVIPETNEDADDPALDCAAVGEGSDADPPTEPDNFDCTRHLVGPMATVRIGSGASGTGGSVTVRLEALDIPSPPGLGAVTVDVRYDPAVVDATACAEDPGNDFDTALCNVEFQTDAVRLTAISTSGVSGDVRLADITFFCLGDVGECSTLDVQVVTFADPSGNPIPFGDEDGEICIGCGDADSDGDVDAVDALFVLQYVVGMRQGDNTCQADTGVICLPSSDVDSDQDVDAVDSLFILQHVVGLRPVLCPAG